MTDTTYVISGVPDANDANPLAPTLADAITSAQTQAVISAAAAATATNQAIAATAQAVAAANSAVDASGYAINAASSAGASAASAVSANGAVYNAASLLDAASISAAAANGSALAAATEAGNSLASAINSANAAVAAGASQTSAAGSAISASASQESASISVTNAGLSASAASASEIAAANNVIFLKSNYQGSLAADPLLDLAGNALTTAAWYYNSTINRIKIYSGSVWAVALNTILTTVGAPASGVGQAGDFAIDSANWIIYGPKVPGSWPSGVSMLGPASVIGPSSSTAGHFATFLNSSGQVLQDGGQPLPSATASQIYVGTGMPGAAAAASTVPILAMPALSGDITTTAGSTSTTLATVSTTSGSVGSSTAIPVLTTNAKGLVTAQSTAVVVAPAGTLSGAALASGVVTSSLTSVGALAMGSLASGFTPVAGSLISSTAALAGGQLAAATSAALGGVKPDGTTITNTAGAISVTYGTTANTATQGNDVRITAAISLLWEYISGLTLSNDVGTPNTKVDVAAGQAADQTNAILMTLASAGVVNFGVTGANGLDTGSQAASTWYAILLIQGSSGVAVMATKATSGSAISPAMPSGYTYYRYVGSVYSNSSTHIAAFTQIGNRFYWSTQTHDLSGGNAVSATLVTLKVPASVVVFPIILLYDSSGLYNDAVWSPSQGAGNPYPLNIYLNTILIGGANGSPVIADTFASNTSSQLYYITNFATAAAQIYTMGWIDPHVSSVF